MSSTEIEYALTVNIEDATTKMREFERMLFRCLSLLHRMGLGEDAERVIVTAQRLISTIRMLRISLIALQAASGPIGWITALMGVTIGAVEAGEILIDIRSQIPNPPI